MADHDAPSAATCLSKPTMKTGNGENQPCDIVFAERKIIFRVCLSSQVWVSLIAQAEITTSRGKKKNMMLLHKSLLYSCCYYAFLALMRVARPERLPHDGWLLQSRAIDSLGYVTWPLAMSTSASWCSSWHEKERKVYGNYLPIISLTSPRQFAHV